MVNKRGFIRTVEAIIATVLLFIFILTVLPGPEKPVEPRNVEYIEESILLEIQSNETLRQEVIDYIEGETLCDEGTDNLCSFLDEAINRLPYEYAFLIKDISDPKPYPSSEELEAMIPDLSEKNLYVKSKVIATEDVSKIIYLYLWDIEVILKTTTTGGTGTTGTTGTTATTLPPTENLVGYWPLNGDAVDDSTYDNDGEVFGASYVAGKVGQALSFNGIDNYVSIPDDSSLDVNAVTLMAWIYVDSYKDDQRIISKEYGTSQPYSIYSLVLSGTDEKKLELRIGINDVRYRVASNLDIPSDQWVHVAATYDGNEVILYIDGDDDVTDPSMTGDIQDNDEPVYIGGSQFYSRSFDGIIDEVRIYNEALLPEEIWDEYILSGGGLIGYWPFDGDTNDYSGDSNHGTLLGSPSYVAGQVGQALDFDSSNGDGVRIPHDDMLNLDSFTMIAWVNPASLGGWRDIMGKGNTGGDVNYYIQTDDEKIVLEFTYNSGSWFSTAASSFGGTLTTGIWHFIAVTYDYSNGNWVVYQNENPVASGTEKLLPDTVLDDFVIGKDPSSGNGWNGMIDEVRLYDRALTGPEISDIYSGS